MRFLKTLTNRYIDFVYFQKRKYIYRNGDIHYIYFKCLNPHINAKKQNNSKACKKWFKKREKKENNYN